MINYVVTDILQLCNYLPLAVGISSVFIMIKSLFYQRKSYLLRDFVFIVYCYMIFVAVFFTRELGSRNGIDLRIFSTLNSTMRSWAYFFENILLFIPFGYLLCYYKYPGRKYIIPVLGFIASLTIEITQLLTKTGFFQVDDLLTNTLGTFVGWLIWKISQFKNK